MSNYNFKYNENSGGFPIGYWYEILMLQFGATMNELECSSLIHRFGNAVSNGILI